MSLKCEPASEPLHIYVKQLILYTAGRYPADEMLQMDFSTDHLEGGADLDGGVDGPCVCSTCPCRCSYRDRVHHVGVHIVVASTM